MIRIILYILFAVTVNISYASTKSDAIKIYNNIIKTSGLYIYPKLTFSNSGEVNAYSSLYKITINKGMLDITNVDELALVLGHELAHFRLGHINSNHKNEYAADLLGWKYASMAGYNVCKGKELFKKFPQRESSSHPHPKDRINRLPRC